ncbi:MAG: lytic transglycosylase domain-containing protein [Thermodesulfobacteriota bacterium]|nr:lytic transglycosylase domain-containing protein [Thermodesulfobacteriota bacterium]
MAQMEILRLNTVLLRGFGHSPSGPDDETGLGEWSGLQGWLQVLGLIQPGQENRESEPDKTAAQFPSPSSAGQPLEQSFDAIVEKAAQDNGLDPNLVRAVVKTESNFDHLAVSKAGAMGLMQLMPGTAKDLGVDNPFDPAQNVHGGARYLKLMLDRYSGDLNRALSAYNWGPGNLDRSTGFLPDETRRYIERVNEYYREFSAGRTA